MFFLVQSQTLFYHFCPYTFLQKVSFRGKVLWLLYRHRHLTTRFVFQQNHTNLPKRSVNPKIRSRFSLILGQFFKPNCKLLPKNHNLKSRSSATQLTSSQFGRQLHSFSSVFKRSKTIYVFKFQRCVQVVRGLPECFDRQCRPFTSHIFSPAESNG